MSKGQKLLIAGGAFIIVTIIVIAVFSIGVYVGRRGWAAGPPSITEPGGPPPPQVGQPPVAPREPLPKSKPDLAGIVQGVTRRSVTIKTGQGVRLVLVNAQTRVRWHDDREASLADLRRNMLVAVFGQLADDGRTLTASLIIILPPRT